MLLSLLILACFPAGAAVFEVPAGDLSAPLSPVLVRDLADPVHPARPVLEGLGRAVLTIPEGLGGETLARTLGPALTDPRLSPVERAAAGAAARVLAEPGAATRLRAAHPGLGAESLPSLAEAYRAAEPLRRAVPREPLLESLLEAARTDPGTGALFEGARRDPLAGLDFAAHALVGGGGMAEELGIGGYGTVYAHPLAPGAAVKVFHAPVGAKVRFITDREGQVEFLSSADQAEQEEGIARALAAAGAGPRHLGSGVLARRPAQVMERIYGRTLQSYFDRRRFTRRELALVEGLLDRLADARLNPGDLAYKDLGNIVLGRTLLDPAPRAYLVDGGWFMPYESGEDLDALRERLEGAAK